MTAAPSSLSTVTVREAVPADYERIGDLTSAAYIDGGFLDPQDFYVGELKDVARRAQQGLLLVAEADGTVAGAAVVTEHDGELAEVSLPGELEFRMLAVAPAFQGRGIGRILVRHILGLAEAREGLTAVTLCSLQSMTAAHALYRSEGFTTEPERDFVLDVPQKQERFPFFIRRIPR